MFEGSYVALVTPFSKGQVDEKKLAELVEFHIANGTHGLVPCGTTGESPTLSHQEHSRVIELVVQYARKRIPVLAGTGSNSTQEAIELTRHAKEAGVDGALMVVPYYNKPSQAGLLAHFQAVTKAVPLPIVLYNIPGRTGVDMLPQTVIQLAKSEKNIVGIKEASGNMDHASEIMGELGPSFILFSGDDSLTLPLLTLGGRGVISVLANIVPKDVAALCDAWKNKDVNQAQEWHRKLFPLARAMFVETNPGPVKAAMGILKMCSPEVRPPLAQLASASHDKLEKALRVYGLLGNRG